MTRIVLTAETSSCDWATRSDFALAAELHTSLRNTQASKATTIAHVGPNGIHRIGQSRSNPSPLICNGHESSQTATLRYTSLSCASKSCVFISSSKLRQKYTKVRFTYRSCSSKNISDKSGAQMSPPSDNYIDKMMPKPIYIVNEVKIAQVRDRTGR